MLFWGWGRRIIQASYNMTSCLYRESGELAKSRDDRDWSLGAQLLISVEVDPRLFLHIQQRVRNILTVNEFASCKKYTDGERVKYTDRELAIYISF